MQILHNFLHSFSTLRNFVQIFAIARIFAQEINFRQRQNFSVWSSEGNSYSLYVLTLCLVANTCNFVRFFTPVQHNHQYILVWPPLRLTAKYPNESQELLWALDVLILEMKGYLIGLWENHTRLCFSRERHNALQGRTIFIWQEGCRFFQGNALLCCQGGDWLCSSSVTVVSYDLVISHTKLWLTVSHLAF